MVAALRAPGVGFGSGSRRDDVAPATVRRAADLVPDFSTTERVADGPEYPEHDTDYQKNPTDRVQNRYTRDVADQEKNDAEDDHVHPFVRSGEATPFG
jgi:hypothetical protein